MADIKLAVVGSRSFNNYNTLKTVIDSIYEDYDYNITTIVSGGARGADSLGEKYADEYVLEKLIFPADWAKHGKRAGFLRNNDIIKNCDVCVCFWDGESHGTKHDIELCRFYKKPCFIYYYLTGELKLEKNNL